MREQIASSIDLETYMNVGLDSYEVQAADVTNMGTNKEAVETTCAALNIEAGTLDTLAEDFNSLIQLFGDGSWTGGYAEEFVSALTKLNTILVEVGPSIRSIATWAQTTSNSYAENDNAHKQRYN